MPSRLTVEITPGVYPARLVASHETCGTISVDGSRPRAIRSCPDMGSETYSKRGFYLEGSPGALCD